MATGSPVAVIETAPQKQLPLWILLMVRIRSGSSRPATITESRNAAADRTLAVNATVISVTGAADAASIRRIPTGFPKVSLRDVRVPPRPACRENIRHESTATRLGPCIVDSGAAGGVRPECGRGAAGPRRRGASR